MMHLCWPPYHRTVSVAQQTPRKAADHPEASGWGWGSVCPCLRTSSPWRGRPSSGKQAGTPRHPHRPSDTLLIVCLKPKTGNDRLLPLEGFKGIYNDTGEDERLNAQMRERESVYVCVREGFRNIIIKTVKGIKLVMAIHLGQTKNYCTGLKLETSMCVSVRMLAHRGDAPESMYAFVWELRSGISKWNTAGQLRLLFFI